MFKIKPRESYDHPMFKLVVDSINQSLGKNEVEITPRGRHIDVTVCGTIPVTIYPYDKMIYSYGPSTDKLAERIGVCLEKKGLEYTVYQVWE